MTYTEPSGPTTGWLVYATWLKGPVVRENCTKTGAVPLPLGLPPLLV
jgi:hypothetical protein